MQRHGAIRRAFIHKSITMPATRAWEFRKRLRLYTEPRTGEAMIIEERMSVYLDSLDAGNGEFLDELEKKAIENEVPVIRPGMQSLLKTLLAYGRPKRILEVGTAVGFSAILMAANTDEDCRITTIENYEKRIPEARANFEAAGYGHRITLLEGDALDVMRTLEPPYDLIFMDAAKGQYIRFLPEVLRLLRQGGMLISDNVLQEGDIIESHYAVERRNRTIYRRMREYLYVLKHTKGLAASVLPVGDGAALAVKLLSSVQLPPREYSAVQNADLQNPKGPL